MNQGSSYIDLINKFWEVDIEASFTHLEIHLFFKLLEINNRLKWKESFRYANSRLESEIGTRTKNLIAAREKLCEFGVIEYEKGTTRSAGKYSLFPQLKSFEGTKESNKESNQGINGKVIRGTLNRINRTKEEKNLLLDNPIEFYPFEEFWSDYDKKRGDKEKLQTKYAKISKADRLKIKNFIPEYKNSTPDKQFRKDPSTFLNQKAWNDELIINDKSIKNGKKTINTGGSRQPASADQHSQDTGW